jgi:Na+-translocating ferredoxin:NAD+ oxidoreductase subunit A
MAKLAALFAMLITATIAVAADEPLIRNVRVAAPDQVRITLSRPVGNLAASNFRFTEAKAPDIPMEIMGVTPEAGNIVLLRIKGRLDAAAAYHLEIRDPVAAQDVHPAPWALWLTVILSSALINNFVFTRYLGLCIFFGVSKKRDTSIGMGITFTIVMVLSSVLSWALFTLVMSPLKLKFLQIIVFIGVVAFLVQALDTILKKTHHSLHQRFGVYLMLITTNCIILAVPLLNAAASSSLAESFALAVGSGLGFALALFLMSCAREKIELARVPQVFQGLPIAFALAGLFALAFMGFSGLDFMR